MQCPFCKAADTKVIDSRQGTEGLQVRRRRECTECSNRFTTYESIELALPRLVKRDGSHVSFDEQKLRAGILKSLEKRPVSMEDVDKAISNIMNKLRMSGERELSTTLVGEWVMHELSKLDEVAYVRFASVYRHFENVDEFKNEIAKLKQSLAEDAV